ncbi:GtrA family protein [Patescibacteria group bacterium]|nr:GtrA family protein [Patescibacteria group bacterium]MBU4353156.1 GtrA family protein [Patescibacteria group bacterium]MBU4477310.1 GtrA family protein [Patescibacteria group bacterium]MCG2698844.1 GtrA family protein [Candidatus Parcubacteria bacterium]
MNNFKKIDLLVAFLIGEVCAWLMFFMGRNLILENPALAAASPYLNYLPIIFPVLCAIGMFAAYFLSKIIPVVYQVAKFVLVGGFNFLLDMGILNFLIFATGISTGLIQSGFKSASFFVAVINSYLLNKYWTFKRTTNESASKEFLQFIVVSLVGLFINVATDYVFVNMVSPFGGMPLKTWAQFSAMLAAAIGMTWNFLGYKFIVFDEKGIKQDGQQNSSIPQIQA